MKFYLAARYSRREELCSYREKLTALGHTSTARWLNGDHQVDDRGLSVEAKREERERFATEDFDDLTAADVVISFTEPPRSTSSRGGRHVEFGAALAMGKRCIVVGPRENVFHALPLVEVFGTIDPVLGLFTDCRACASCYMEPDSGFIRGHEDAGAFGVLTRIAVAKDGHCGPTRLKFEQHPLRSADGSLGR